MVEAIGTNIVKLLQHYAVKYMATQSRDLFNISSIIHKIILRKLVFLHRIIIYDKVLKFI